MFDVKFIDLRKQFLFMRVNTNLVRIFDILIELLHFQVISLILYFK